MTPWHLQPFAGFDLESTGVHTRGDRIVTAAVATFNPTPTPPWDIASESWLVNPQIPIPAAATAVHGITTEFARANGRPIEEVLPELTSALAKCFLAGFPVVTMNGPYDFSMLHWECLRHGVPTVEELLGTSIGPVVDVYVIDKQFDKYRRGSRKLTDLCQHYGVRIDGAHDALFDVVAAARVAYKQMLRYPALAKSDPHQLHSLQISWKAAQSADFEQHLAKQGRRTDAGQPIQIDRCWPVCTNERHPQ